MTVQTDSAVSPSYRAVRLGGSLKAFFEDREDGSLLVRSAEPLGEYPARLTDRLIAGAQAHGDRVIMARRGADGEWVELTWAEALARARRIAQALLDRGLSAERPVMILCGNGLEHFELGLGAMLAGIPFAPISPAYSTVSKDFVKLRHIVATLTPGLVFVDDTAPYADAIAQVFAPDVEVVAVTGSLPGRAVTSFGDLRETQATPAVEAAHAKVGPDTIAKFLFTSGSTKMPKAVINTQRMLCSNQQMLVQCLPFLAEEPPVLVDWLPWNHTFGANHNIGIILYNGGTLYIDDGKPTPQGIGETLRNLREIAPTIYFNVPKGLEEIAVAMETDKPLADRFLSRVQAIFFSGAGLSPQVWNRLDRACEQHCGERIRLLTGLGMTETSPFALCANGGTVFSGVLGLPAPGLEVKLVSVEGKMEVRYRGPNVTPGYWRAPEQTAESFDDEGFFCSGDAARYIDPAKREIGFAFDGRIAEDFKLSTGTFVSVGPLRARILAASGDYLTDVVIAGLNRDDIGVLFFPRPDACRELAGLAASAPLSEVAAAPAVRDFFQQLVNRLWAEGTGSASRIARAVIVEDMPSVDHGEMTDKGSVNQRAVLARRAALVDALYDESHPALLLPARPSA
ncbi:feruloyl-CoA synthase [Achromobacter sp. GG226]|uniref:feruloyl-CoA synthase n=1 Tax=Verticiella alkaliphila TaxID=2779529 RepID=UPI001C0B3C81|nr:feruloyl-CoA synthase [Verticiella sp. GG226]MBU4611844.1 feruloyl-CoA synthase [Verticiella sp. GG226]